MPSIILDTNSILVGMAIAGAIWVAYKYYEMKRKMQEIENRRG